MSSNTVCNHTRDKQIGLPAERESDLVSITIETVYKLLNCQFFNVNFPLSHNLAIFSFLGNCNFYD